MKTLFLVALLAGCGDDTMNTADDLSVLSLPDLTAVAMPDMTTTNNGDMTQMAGAKHNVTLNLVGYQIHSGQKFTLYVVDGNTLAGMTTVTLNNMSNQSVSINSVVENGKTYNLDFWVDYNSNNMCDDAGTDHSWRLSTGTINGDYTTSKTHDTNWVTVCR